MNQVDIALSVIVTLVVLVVVAVLVFRKNKTKIEMDAKNVEAAAQALRSGVESAAKNAQSAIGGKPQ